MHLVWIVLKTDWIKLDPQGWVSSWTCPLNPRPCHAGWPQGKATQGKHKVSTNNNSFHLRFIPAHCTCHCFRVADCWVQSTRYADNLQPLLYNLIVLFDKITLNLLRHTWTMCHCVIRSWNSGRYYEGSSWHCLLLIKCGQLLWANDLSGSPPFIFYLRQSHVETSRLQPV